jgi:hypothetical protein
MTDTAPDQLDPSTLDGYEPPVEGETSKDRRNRKARNRRRAERAQADAEQAAEPSTARKPGPGRPSARGKREQAVMGILTGAGIAVMAFDEFDGTTIIEGAPDLARSLAALADKRPAVARALDSLTETSAWAEVAVSLGAIAVPIIRHHATRPPEVEPAESAEPHPWGNTVGGRTDAERVAEARQVDPDAPVFTVRPVDPNAPEPVPTFRARQ